MWFQLTFQLILKLLDGVEVRDLSHQTQEKILDGAGFVSKVIAVLQIEMLPQSKKHTIV